MRDQTYWLSTWFHPFLEQLAPGHSASQTGWMQGKASGTEGVFLTSAITDYANNFVLKEKFFKKNSTVILSSPWIQFSRMHQLTFFFFSSLPFVFFFFFSCLIIGFASSLQVTRKPVHCTYASSHWSFSFVSWLGRTQCTKDIIFSPLCC